MFIFFFQLKRQASLSQHGNIFYLTDATSKRFKLLNHLNMFQ